MAEKKTETEFDSAWNGDSRRRAVLLLVAVGDSGLRSGDLQLVADSLLCIRMVVSRPAQNLEQNRSYLMEIINRSA